MHLDHSRMAAYEKGGGVCFKESKGVLIKECAMSHVMNYKGYEISRNDNREEFIAKKEGQGDMASPSIQALKRAIDIDRKKKFDRVKVYQDYGERLRSVEDQAVGGMMEIPDGYFVSAVDLDAEPPYCEIVLERDTEIKRKVNIPRSLAYYLVNHDMGSIKKRKIIEDKAKNEIRNKIKEALDLK